MENIASVREYLGGRSVLGSVPRSELDFVPLLRRGFPFEVFNRVGKQANLSDDALCVSIGLPKRTAARRKKEASRLKPAESERLLRLARVLASARAVLGTDSKARLWLVRENRALGGSTPIGLLDTDIGCRNVLDVLKRVEYGVHS